MPHLSSIVAASAIAAAALAYHAHAGPPEVLVGGPCEGCEAVFEGRPEALASTARIAPAGEPGEPLFIKGVVTAAAKRPVAGVIVYAYHTDAKGAYPSTDAHRRTAKHRHGMLRGFARTDAAGRYAFETRQGHSSGRPERGPGARGCGGTRSRRGKDIQAGFGATELLRGGPSVEPAEPALLSTRCPQRGRAYVGSTSAQIRPWPTASATVRATKRRQSS